MLSIADESNFKVNHGLYAVKFWATWCQPCKMIMPTIEKLDSEFDNIEFLSVDVEQVPALAKKYKITSLPTLLLIANGEEVGRIIGIQLITPLRSTLSNLVQKYDTIEEEEVEMPEQVAVSV